MKLKAITLFALMNLFSLSAFAQFFPASAYVSVLPLQVSVQVFNPYYEPIICSGQVYGQTFQGPLLNAYFVEQFLPAGTNRFAFVYTNTFNPFTNGWANINCRFARIW